MKHISKKITALILSLILAVAVIPLSGLNIEANATSGDDIVTYARTFIGHAYVSGGTGPDVFDCSGFASYIYGHFGINIPNSTTLIWNDVKSGKETYGTVIDHGSIEKAQAGDLIVWVGHVSIYTSNGGCVEALNSRYGVTDSMPVNSHTNGMDYYVLRVKGVDGASVKPAAPVITADKTTVKKGETITLSWKPVDGISNYRVECTLWPLPYIDETTSSTSYTFSPAISGTYTVCVYSVNSAGETQSNKITVKVESDSTASEGGDSPIIVVPVAGGIDLSSFKAVIDMIIKAFQAFIQFMTNIVSTLSNIA